MTIVAQSTPRGRGAIAVIRMSGAESFSILERVARFESLKPKAHLRKLVHGWIVDANDQRLDEVLVAFFKAPYSYTGEDMVEIHCHGGEVVVEEVLRVLFLQGAREALRGEFTKRAFENGKLDLSRAEAVIRLIDACSKEQLTGAAKALSGDIERLARKVKENLLGVMARLQAMIEFGDEPDICQLDQVVLGPLLQEIIQLKRWARRAGSNSLEIVVAGRPNVGKSSLVNALTKRKVSIVTEEPGTTRDAVAAQMVLGGMRVSLVDTAGLVPEETIDPIGCCLAAKEAQQVARERLRGAGLILWVTDQKEEKCPTELLGEKPIIQVVNKVDLWPRANYEKEKNRLEQEGKKVASALTHEGIEELLAELSGWIEREHGPAEGIPLSLRQENALDRIQQGIERAERVLAEGALELAAEDTKEALLGASELVGEGVSLDVLDRIFEEFCIGK